MTWLDIGIVMLIVLGGWRGRRRGIAREISHIGSALLGLTVGYRVAPGLADTASVTYGTDQNVAYVVAFLLLAGTITGVGIALAPRIDALLVRWKIGRRLRRWGGFVAGACKSALLLFILVIAAVQVPWSTANRAVFHSPVALWMLRAAPAVYQTAQSLIFDESHSFDSKSD